jgi:hypothetical protein
MKYRFSRFTRFVIVFLIALSDFSSVAAAQSKPNFTGPWTLLDRSAELAQETVNPQRPS